ncbi:MAG: phosphoribosyltransferase family protein [Candidatus Hydrothermarchaeota archaeon]
MYLFRDRREAGRALLRLLEGFRGEGVVVLAIPRGGLLVGAEIAKGLKVPLDIVVTKKIGAPMEPELALGAVGAGKEVVIDAGLVRQLGVPWSYIKGEIDRLEKVVEARYRAYRGDSNLLDLEGRTVILADDGMATGSTMLVAAKLVQKQKPRRLVVAVPVASREAVDRLKEVAEVICPHVPSHFQAVGQFYAEFPQVSDEEARACLEGG